MKGLVLFSFLALSTPAFATAPVGAPLAGHVSREDLLDLENAQLKFAAMDRQIEDIQRAAKEIRDHRDALLKKYGIKPEELGKTIGIANDGTIQRTATEAAPSKKEKK
jgi:hypothetical protein